MIRREDAANETHGPNKAKILGAYSRAHNFQVTSSILLYIYRSNQAINQESSYYQNKIYVAYHPEIIIAADVKWADLSFFWTSVRHGYSVVSSNLHAFGK